MIRKHLPVWGTPLALILVAMLLASCGFKRKAYEDPITKNTQQPDKILFDKSINDIEHGRYEEARLTLNTLINTYDSSEYLAKAKLAIADSWFREGGVHGMAQAEAEYKDFELFYPTMPEAAESQYKICNIHYLEMEMPDRDPDNALRAEQECRQLITQYPNSKWVLEAEQKLRDIQEVLAEAEFDAGDFYHRKGANAAAANRMKGLVQEYPLYSHADEALWEEADSYSRMGPRFRANEGDALAEIVRNYPLSPLAEQARKKLQSLELPVPEADPKAVARMKYDKENYHRPGMMHRATAFISGKPDVSHAAQTGEPTMTNPTPTIPVSVPLPVQAGVNEVTVAPVTDPTALDKLPDARSNPAGSGGASSPTGAAAGTPASGAKETPATPSTPAAAPAAAPASPAPAADSKSKKKKKKSDKKTDAKSTTAPQDK
ncbi:MAG TPA: outer membrane protein assembly factor BamD [Bryobacteraceae bacterium]|nr:outer membrane protein assembly factor BamD [Bryobacteraceae bacterium]